VPDLTLQATNIERRLDQASTPCWPTPVYLTDDGQAVFHCSRGILGLIKIASTTADPSNMANNCASNPTIHSDGEGMSLRTDQVQ
jgi:hypothetical protein